MTESNNVRIKRHFSVVAHGADLVELRHGVWNSVSFTLEDDSGTGLLLSLLNRLDGTATPAALARELNIPREDVEAVIDELDRLGVLESGPTSSIDYYLDTQVPTLVGGEPPARKPVRLIGDPALTARIATLLRESPDAPEANVVPPDDPVLRKLFAPGSDWAFDGLAYHERLAAAAEWADSFVVLAMATVNPLHGWIVNRASLEHGFPWMHAAVDGPLLMVGPTCVPRRSSCFECFEKRVTMNLRQDASYVRYKQALAERRVRLGELPLEPALQATLASHVALEVLNYANTDCSFTRGRVLTMFLPTMEFAFNEVLRLPGCPGCGTLTLRDDDELHFDVSVLLEDSAEPVRRVARVEVGS